MHCPEQNNLSSVQGATQQTLHIIEIVENPDVKIILVSDEISSILTILRFSTIFIHRIEPTT